MYIREETSKIVKYFALTVRGKIVNASWLPVTLFHVFVCVCLWSLPLPSLLPLHSSPGAGDVHLIGWEEEDAEEIFKKQHFNKEGRHCMKFVTLKSHGLRKGLIIFFILLPVFCILVSVHFDD